jgi:DAK2 domain fusion protein YloV
MRAALDGARKAKGAGVAQVMKGAAQGAVMGARGNSGVILSQILAGLARGLEGHRTCDGPQLAAALAEGAAVAYRAVTRPVEGTILTVARAAGEGAGLAVSQVAAGSTPSPRHVLSHALAAAHEAVRRTPNQLPILRQAGVVDAGGEGYRVILEGMVLSVTGDRMPETSSTATLYGEDGPRVAASGGSEHELAVPDEEWGYCTQFLIRGDGLDVARLRRELQELAASALVVGDETVVRVHGHTEDPGQLLTYATRQGRLERVSIEDMDAQHDAWLRSQVQDVSEAAAGPTGAAGRDDAPPPADAVATLATLATLATVAVAPGSGLGDVFRSLGAGEVVPGGQTMNPSASELFEAAQRTGAGTVLILPNNGNVVMTAQQAAGLAEGSAQRLLIVNTRTVPQGIAAQLAFDPGASPEANLSAMADAAAGVRTVEVTRATRSVTIGDVQVQAGDVLALLDDEVVAADDDPVSAARQALERAGAADAELITVYWGEAVGEADAAAFAAALRPSYPKAEFELLPGGQPHYDYLISVE